MQDGPTVLVAHSFSGMILSEAGIHPKVSSLVYVAARAPDANEKYAQLAARFPKPPASAGLVTTNGLQQLNETAFLNDFANAVDPVKARLLYAVQHLTRRRFPQPPGRRWPRGVRNRHGMRSRSKIAQSTRTWNASWPHA